MKPAFLKDDDLIAEIESARSDKTDTLHTWWLGQSGFLVMSAGKTVLFDPYLSDSLTRKYATTDKPHTRITEQVIDPSKLEGIDIVTSSHNHTDHLDKETLTALFRANPELSFIIPEANRAFIADRLESDSAQPIGLNDGLNASVKGVQFHGIASAHDEIKTNEKGEHHFMGFIIELGPWKIYHSGDTRLYGGLASSLKRFNLDLAFLPINGYKPERRVAGNLSSQEAAQLADECSIKIVVPHHYDLFEFNTADPADFENACQSRNVSFHILRNGQRLSLER